MWDWRTTMEDDKQEVQIQPVKMECPERNCAPTEIDNYNLTSGALELKLEDSSRSRHVKIDTKPVPLYNLYDVNIKEEINDPDLPSSNVKSEFDLGQLNIPYFDHSSVIQQNLKTEPDDEGGYCEDPLYGADSVPLGKTSGTPFQVLGQNPSEKKRIGERSFCCLLCNQSFLVKGGCEHQMTCEKCLTSAPKLNEHKTSSTGDKKGSYKCETCGKEFTRYIPYAAHLRTHVGEKPFGCETCGKMFKQKYVLVTHVRTHTGERPFECETCGKGFTAKAALANHMRIHTGEKQFVCETCGKDFYAKASLANHMKTHTGEKLFKCEMCGKGFALKNNMVRHKTCHTRDKSFKCDTCGKCFVRKESLKDHMKVHV